jgi:NADH dehydrogenase [ubiquinone] 1 alpha subcomplex assembly factor 1
MISALTTILLILLTTQPMTGQTDPIRIVDFENGLPEALETVNDPVMGGRSTSGLEWAGGAAVFAGDLSLENNGGFASFRVRVQEGRLAGATLLMARVRGDGRRYQLRVRPGGRFDGVSYQAEFVASAEWTTVSLPVDGFEPTFRGFRPPGAGALDPAKVREVGIMLADKKEGPFRLEIAWIGMGATLPE